MGAWIETAKSLKTLSANLVAPHVGAWIETLRSWVTGYDTSSHPMWVRGLKLLLLMQTLSNLMVSHPMWVRGLKHINNYTLNL